MLHLTEKQWKDKVKLWFFRNLVNEQRTKLFEMFDFPETHTHGEQMHLFRYVFRDWWKFSERQPANAVCVEAAFFDNEVGEWIHQIILTPTEITDRMTHWRYLRAPE